MTFNEKTTIEKKKVIINRINDILNDFLIPFDCEACFGTDFMYTPSKSRITYALLIADTQGEHFRQFAENIFPEIKADIFLWSFFHELGHHETDEFFDTPDWVAYDRMCRSNPSDSEYFNFPTEYEATCWAGRYMKTHIEDVTELWNKLKPEIHRFFKEE